MSWRQAVTFLVIVFVIVVVQAILAGPVVDIQNDLTDSVDWNNEHFDGPSTIENMVTSWFRMGLVAIFLLMGVAVARVVRRELTRQGRI